MIHHKGTLTLETPRLILRRAAKEDSVSMFHNWASDPEVTKFMTWPTHDSIETSAYVLASWTEAYEKIDYYQWLIVLKELGQPIGSVSVVRMDELTESCEIGYCIGRLWWHQGIMTEAVSAVIRYLFHEVGMRRIVARHDMNNPRSGNVMKRCGMQFEGIQIGAGQNNQGICDLCCYCITNFEVKQQ